MPREQRKRGKKHKNSAPEQAESYEENHSADTAQEATPSWITHAPKQQELQNVDEPFGQADQEVKAYFRTVDLQIKQWIEDAPHTALAEGEDDERRLFFLAALQEMSGKELVLATDPECSTILERILHSMDDFARRVFMDALSGNHSQLVKHRFGSHVVQTLLEIGRKTVSRESAGVFPSAPEDQSIGELRTFIQLTSDFCKEIQPDLSTLLHDAFASHVLRALITLLVPQIAPPPSADLTRSRKSSTWKAKQGPMNSMFSAEDYATEQPTLVPPSFDGLARTLLIDIRQKLDENEVRALGASKVAAPLLRLLLALEAHLQLTDQSGSLMDSLLSGIITLSHDDPDAPTPASDYLGTLLRDPASSHLLETILEHVPETVFRQLWQAHFAGQLPRLAKHPVANFVVAKAVSQAPQKLLLSILEEFRSGDGLGVLVKTKRTGVIQALVERAKESDEVAGGVVQAVKQTFGVEENDEAGPFVQCILSLQTREEMVALHTDQHSGEGQGHSPVSIQGSVILQALLQLPAPHYQCVTSSILALSIVDLLNIAYDVTASRVLDAYLSSSTVTKKEKNALAVKFIGSYEQLVDHRIGSRVGDRIWAWAEGYLKEKIARSLMPHERYLVGSEYGRFFARKANLNLLRRRPDEWRDLQTQSATQSTIAASAVTHSSTTVVSTSAVDGTHSEKKDTAHRKAKKRKVEETNEIDVLFAGAGLDGKKTKRAALGPDTDGVTMKGTEKRRGQGDDANMGGMKEVMDAIRTAPVPDKKEKRRKQQE